ncbi:IS66 family transposase [Salinispira pacifica]|uniref:IS66 family transposase n=1 Tax=Salinispira pacifica TaxID=1307761 RepID=UPI00059B8AB5
MNFLSLADLKPHQISDIIVIAKAFREVPIGNDLTGKTAVLFLELLEGCTTYLQTDGYEVYDQIAGEEPGITLVGCWAHARRRFHDAKKASKKAGAADEGIKYIRKLYQIRTVRNRLALGTGTRLPKGRTEKHVS